MAAYGLQFKKICECVIQQVASSYHLRNILYFNQKRIYKEKLNTLTLIASWHVDTVTYETEGQLENIALWNTLFHTLVAHYTIQQMLHAKQVCHSESESE